MELGERDPRRGSAMRRCCEVRRASVRTGDRAPLDVMCLRSMGAVDDEQDVGRQRRDSHWLAIVVVAKLWRETGSQLAQHIQLCKIFRPSHPRDHDAQLLRQFVVAFGGGLLPGDLSLLLMSSLTDGTEAPCLAIAHQNSSSAVYKLSRNSIFSMCAKYLHRRGVPGYLALENRCSCGFSF